MGWFQNAVYNVGQAPILAGLELTREGISRVTGEDYNLKNPFGTPETYNNKMAGDLGNSTGSSWYGATYGPTQTGSPAQTNPTSPTNSSTTAAQQLAQQQAAARANALSLISSGRNTLNSTIGTSIDSQGRQMGGSIIRYIDNLREQQLGIDKDAYQNELSKIEGTRGVYDYVGRGIRSGGVMLANRNAGQSSGAEGIANAYGQIGRQQLSQVGNQYAEGLEGIEDQQRQLGVLNKQQGEDLEESKQGFIDQLLSQAQSELARLDQIAINASLPDRIAIDQEKAAIKQRALGALSQYDQQLQQGIASVKPAGRDASYAKAREMSMAGQAPANAFSFNTDVPVQFQNTGPFPSSLPLFTFPGNRKRT